MSKIFFFISHGRPSFDAISSGDISASGLKASTRAGRSRRYCSRITDVFQTNIPLFQKYFPDSKYCRARSLSGFSTKVSIGRTGPSPSFALM